MNYFLAENWLNLDTYCNDFEHFSSDSKSEADDDDFYSDDDLDFINALYPILEYSYNDSEEVFITPKRACHEWVFEKIFTFEHEAIAAVNSEEIWVPHGKKSYTSEGQKVVYRCNKVPREGPQCAAKVYLLYHHATTSIMLFRTDAKHDHLSILDSLHKSGLKKEKRTKRLRQKSILETFLRN